MIKEKIKNINALSRIVLRLKRKGKSIVFTNGCFDILHYGHAKYLEDAKKKGDCLIVAVNSDASMRRIKGPARPLVKARDRASLIAALASVDYVIIFNESTPFNLIKGIRPDVLIKGSDWKKADIVGADLVHSYGGKILTIPLVEGRSTTNLIKKIAARF